MKKYRKDEEICNNCHSFSGTSRLDTGWCMKLRCSVSKGGTCINYN